MRALRGLKKNNTKQTNETNKSANNFEERNVILQGEWNDYEEIEGIKINFPDPKNVANFTAYLTPDEGLYKGATFAFKIEVPKQYPFSPPKVECATTPIYHPNIDFEGHVCLNILRKEWSPTMGITTVLFGLNHLFSEPNAFDFLPNRKALKEEFEAAALMIKNPAAFEQLVKRTLRGGYVRELDQTFPKLLN